ncbi:hypothetical protein BD289DRAFT_447860 [Coniella lustricola]|uniref:Flavin reductase like domain-containing protein n=1 Tax=Coniella lustricola TaxID=2025994 RepID=A0A2T2ZSP5_9PEZI|nr:hypothetical protein BD289DRAFT_447860 [Coniella lustricola]
MGLRHISDTFGSLPRLLRCPPPSTSTTVSLQSRRLLLTSSPPKMKEAEIKRNPHPDFKKVEASRSAWDRDASFEYSQTPAPSWQFGSGANDLPVPAGAKHITIDPYAEGRAPVNNYKLLISAIVPRPIAFVSTLSPEANEANGGDDAKQMNATTNLAPFSYFQMVNHDPPLFIIGFASSLEKAEAAKHTLHNLHETGECTINIISEHFIEAANSTSINAPYGVSEWAVSGLTPAYDCETVKPARVKEAIFSIEGRLHSVKEFESRSNPGTMSGTMAIVEGTRFWVREDAINDERNIIDPAVLRPMSRLGGITYGRTVDGLELPRPDFEKDLGGQEAYKKLETKRNGMDGKLE